MCMHMWCMCIQIHTCRNMAVYMCKHCSGRNGESRVEEERSTWQQAWLVQLVTSLITSLQALPACKKNRIFYFASPSCGMWIGSCPKWSGFNIHGRHGTSGHNKCTECEWMCVIELAPSKAWKQSDLCKLCIGVGMCILYVRGSYQSTHILHINIRIFPFRHLLIVTVNCALCRYSELQKLLGA